MHEGFLANSNVNLSVAVIEKFRCHGMKNSKVSVGRSSGWMGPRDSSYPMCVKPKVIVGLF